MNPLDLCLVWIIVSSAVVVAGLLTEYLDRLYRYLKGDNIVPWDW